METELKFALSQEARECIERRMQGAARAPTVEDIRSTYFDTAAHALRAQGLSLRLRQSGSHWVQTVKFAGNSIIERQEWEWPLRSGELNRDRLLEVPPHLASLLKQSLHPLFHTEVRRMRFDLRPTGDIWFELAFDEGMIIAGEKREPVSELELELKAGPKERLFHEALELLSEAPLALISESKAERGYQLLGGHGPMAHEAPDVDCDKSFSLAQAFRKISAEIIDHLLANQPAALCGEGQEGIHQMRIAIRRLRSLLMLFEPFVEPHASKCFEAELRRLGQVLGEARDWDVFLEESLPRLQGNDTECGWLQPLSKLAIQRQRAAHQAAKKAVLDPAFARFVLAFQGWTYHDGGVLTANLADHSLGTAAPLMLTRLARKVRKRLAKAECDDNQSLHRVRKSAKKLRYGIEFLQGAYEKKTKRYRKRLHALQKRLGNLNDLATFTRLAAGLARNGRIDIVPALGIVAGRSEAKQYKERKRGAKVIRRFRREDPFWS